MRFWTRKDPAMEMAQLFAKVLEQQTIENRKLVEVITASAENATKAALATTEVLQQHLALFQVTDAPEKRIIRDEDEYAEEVARLREQGFPVEASPEQQMAFVSTNLEIESLSAELGL